MGSDWDEKGLNDKGSSQQKQYVQEEEICDRDHQEAHEAIPKPDRHHQQQMQILSEWSLYFMGAVNSGISANGVSV